MIVNKLLNYNSSKYSEDNHEGDIQQIDKDLITLFNCLQGRVRFGSGNTGSDGENISGQFLQIFTSGTSNFESSYNHTVGSVPVGYLSLWVDKPVQVYGSPTSGTVWTNSSISLRCSGTSVTALLFLLK